MGDTRRIPKATDKKYSDPEFEVLLRIAPNKLKHNLSPFTSILKPKLEA